MKILKSLFVCVFSIVAFTSCNDTKKDNSEEVVNETVEAVEEAKETPTTPNIVGVAAGNEAFSTLVAAVKAAGLVETLSGDGPFTVFAPTNDAFGKLPDGTVDNLLKPESKDQLTAVLTYHVVSGKFEASAVIEAINANGGKFTVDTVQGGKIDLSLNNGSVTLTDANGNTSVVVIPDVAASNGVIHAIDSVVMPK